MELLDRDFQLKLLHALSKVYPEQMGLSEIDAAVENPDERKLSYNSSYLEEHSLVRVLWREAIGIDKHPIAIAITAKGIDFIKDDGGLSATLGVVTIKLHSDTIRDLLVNKIEKEVSDPTVKEQLIKKAKSLPADALGKISQKLMEKGLSNPGATVDWITGLLS